MQPGSSKATLVEGSLPAEDEDPFYYDLCDDTISIASGADPDTVTENTFNIEVFSRGTEQLKMRALMDTGAAMCFMRKGLAIKTGCPIYQLPPSTRPLVVASGEEMYVEEYVVLTWYFADRGFCNARSFTMRFMICPDTSPYDVVLGWNFIKTKHLL